MLRKFVTENGRDEVGEWYSNLTAGQRGGVRPRLDYLRQSREHWEKNRYKSINSGAGKALGEIRLKIGGVQYRLIGFFGPADSGFTVLTVEVKKSPKLADHIWDKAQARRKRVEANKELSHEWEI